MNARVCWMNYPLSPLTFRSKRSLTGVAGKNNKKPSCGSRNPFVKLANWTILCKDLNKALCVGHKANGRPTPKGKPMSERTRRKDRQAARRAPEPIASAKPPANRGTFRVAQAQRQLAAELPGVVRNRQAERLTTSQPKLAPVDPLPTLGQVEAQRRPSRVATATRAPQPKLDKGDLHLKCRPKSNKPASGGGSGRAFIPWNKDC